MGGIGYHRNDCFPAKRPDCNNDGSELEHTEIFVCANPTNLLKLVVYYQGTWIGKLK